MTAIGRKIDDHYRLIFYKVGRRKPGAVGTQNFKGRYIGNVLILGLGASCNYDQA
jgi:hypothetical protein